MDRKVAAAVMLAAMCLSLSGCPEPFPGPPTSRAEHSRMQRANPQAYPAYTIVLHNIRRVFDRDLPTQERMESLRLAMDLGEGEPELRARLVAVLSAPDAPMEMRREVLDFLLAKDYADLAEHVVPMLSRLRPGDKLLDSILDWLVKHPQPDVLAEVVKLWAKEESIIGPREKRFRSLVEQMTGRPWDQALLEALNTPSFSARGSTLEILAARTTAAALQQNILGMQPQTEAVTVLRAYLNDFSYLPADAQELVASVWVYKARHHLLGDAAKLASTWRQSAGYHFNIRDFHLLSQLGLDPVQTDYRRTDLLLKVGKDIKGRPHVQRRRGSQTHDDELWANIKDLQVPDAWNLYLLNSMLMQARVQQALRIMAERDLQDRAAAWGGLVFLRGSRPQAMLYPADKAARADDLTYVPTDRAQIECRDALCMFRAHFEKVLNTDRAGPTDEELADAKRCNYYGLVLARLNQRTFCAHYYNPRGIVVSLGVFPFGQDRAAERFTPTNGRAG